MHRSSTRQGDRDAGDPQKTGGYVAIDVAPGLCLLRRRDVSARRSASTVNEARSRGGYASDQSDGVKRASQDALGTPQTQPRSIRYLVGGFLLERPLFAGLQSHTDPRPTFLGLTHFWIHHGSGFRHRPFPVRGFIPADGWQSRAGDLSRIPPGRVRLLYRLSCSVISVAAPRPPDSVAA